MDEQHAEMLRQVHLLMDAHRADCLWHVRPDYYPQTSREAINILESIERNADLPTFKQAAKLRQWLLQHTSAPSANY